MTGYGRVTRATKIRYIVKQKHPNPNSTSYPWMLWGKTSNLVRLSAAVACEVHSCQMYQDFEPATIVIPM